MIWIPPRLRASREVRGCTGKIKYPSKFAAVKVLKKVNNAGLSAYLCRHCNGWHLGNNWKKGGWRTMQVETANKRAWEWLEEQIRNAKGRDAKRRNALERVVKAFSRCRDIFSDAKAELEQKRREMSCYEESGKATRAARRREEIAVLEELFREFPKGNRSAPVGD